MMPRHPSSAINNPNTHACCPPCPAPPNYRFDCGSSINRPTQHTLATQSLAAWGDDVSRRHRPSPNRPSAQSASIRHLFPHGVDKSGAGDRSTRPNGGNRGLSGCPRIFPSTCIDRVDWGGCPRRCSHQSKIEPHCDAVFFQLGLVSSDEKPRASEPHSHMYAAAARSLPRTMDAVPSTPTQILT